MTIPMNFIFLRAAEDVTERGVVLLLTKMEQMSTCVITEHIKE